MAQQQNLHPIAVKKRDGRLEEFNLETLASTIEAGARDLGGHDFKLSKQLAEDIARNLANKGRIVETGRIDEYIFDYLLDNEFDGTAYATKIRSKRKENARSNVGVLGEGGGGNSTNAFLMVGSASKETATKWDRERIIASLINEGGLDLQTAQTVAEDAETDLFNSSIPNITTQLIRENVHTQLIKRDLNQAANQYRSFGIPRADLESIMMDKIRENSNVNSNNPEAINFGLSGGILKSWALSTVFSPDVAEAHSSGAVHLHDLDMPTRLYCSAHSIEYIKKFGLDLPSSSSVSGPAKHSEVLIGHLNTFLATMQAYYAGALGVGDINVLFAPHLQKDLEIEGRKKTAMLETKLEKDQQRIERLKAKGKDVAMLEELLEEDKKYLEGLVKDPMSALKDEEIDEFLEQSAQSLIYNGSQNAFSRGAQTLFLDFNIHAGVPKHLKDTPVILDGKYQLRNKEGQLTSLEERTLSEQTRAGYDLMELVNPENGEVVLKEKTKMLGNKQTLVQERLTEEGEKVVTYGDYEDIANRFTKALLKKFGEGDHRGAPFPFPKCDFHINEDSLDREKNPQLAETIDYAFEQASKNGSVYFVMDRDDVTMSACCRLRTTIDDDYVTKHPESMRFCGFQNVTINMAQAAYRAARKGKKNLEGFFEELDWSMDIAVKAHLQKKAQIEEFQGPGGPQYATSRPAQDGKPYVDLDKATYIVGLSGLNDAMKFLYGKELHEMDGEELENPLRTVAHMNVYSKKLSKENNNMKISLEESPAESASKRLASIDLLRYPESKDYVKGDLESGVVYYTNSVHLAPDAPVDLITRIKRQGLFHSAIDSGAITHAFVGEERPSPEAIGKLVKKTFEDTQTAQLTISPEFTVCEDCDTTHPGLKDNCPDCDSEDVYGMSRIVGYYSKIFFNNAGKKIYNWIDSKVLELDGRHQGDYSVAGENANGLEMPKLDGNSNGEYVIHRYGKPDCDACERLEGQADKVIQEYAKQGIEVKQIYHNVYTDDGMTSFLASRLNPSRIPAVVITKDNEEVFRRSTDWGKEKDKFVRDKHLRNAIQEHVNSYEK